MKTKISIQNVMKKYGDNVIIPNLSLEVSEGEFFTLLGPSGCGKTTLLRMIAGFNSIEDGAIYFNNQKINDIPPHKRNIGMVFQNYAIFPHLTVRQNVEYGLKERKINQKEIDERVNDIMEATRILQYADRLPQNLSGGQQQRIALARAVVIQPTILLMDEPLSNLDAKLRIEMRNLIKQIQRQFQITTVYVTHDQEEALAVSDRIAVMNHGELQQVGKPKDIYLEPTNTFVSSFIGHSNLFKIDAFKDSSIQALKDKNPSLELVGIRPENLQVSPEGISITIQNVIFLGSYIEYYFTVGDDLQGFESDVYYFIQETSLNQEEYTIGQQIKLSIIDDKFVVYDKDGMRG